MRGEHIVVASLSPRAPLAAEESDQPRVRGEHWELVHDSVDSGSAADQPRVRGEHSLSSLKCRPCPVRISPACAGNTVARLTGRGSDQPRVRGEHQTCPTRDRCTDQPRVRGEHDRRTAERLHAREPDQPRVRGEHVVVRGRRPAREPDQPRVRGEHTATGHRTIEVPMPPDQPRVRGEHSTSTSAMGCVDVYRISPACAGNTARGAVPRPASADQPRVRGEHECFRCRSLEATTDQPRVRGEHLINIGGCSATGGLRISPACAGNTFFTEARVQPRLLADQPRVRGEHNHATLVGRALAPPDQPRVRGEHDGVPACRVTAPFDRISPACAGNTRRWPAPRRTSRYQPRVRGEHTRPRALAEVLHRISPACAGNTSSRSWRDSRSTGSAPRARGTPADWRAGHR